MPDSPMSSSWVLLLGVAYLSATLVISAPVRGASPSEVIVIAEEYAFNAPDRVAGGWKTIRLKNQGHEIHHVQFLKLSQGKSVKDFDEALAADSTQLPSWVVRYGGVNSVMPGAEATVSIDLDPGDYVLICGIPNARGRPHAAIGMTKALNVTERDAVGAVPSPTLALSMKEFSYTLGQPLAVGHQTIVVRNDGKEAHEVLLLALNPGASVLDFLEFYRPGVLRNPAGRTIGGVTGLASGRQAFLPMNVEPGRYGILCFLADPVRRRPHFMEGMWMDIDVPSLSSPASP